MNLAYCHFLIIICLLGIASSVMALQPTNITTGQVNSPTQSTTSTHAPADQEELITINMRNAEIVSVIQWMAEQTNKKIIVDPRVKGKVSILANVPMTIDDAYQVFLTMLNVYGYAGVEQGDILRIVPSAASKSSPANIIYDFQADKGGQQAIYVYEASAVNPQKLQTALRPLISTSGYLSAIQGTNKLIIADAYDNIHRLVSLIKQIDQEGSIKIHTLKLQHASANTVAAVVTSLLQSDNNKNFSIASDERSNSVLMTGDAIIEKRVKQLISQLDRPISNADNTKVIYLHYTDANEMLPILKNMGEAVQKDNKNHNISNQVINVSASKTTNAIIITAPPDILYTMEKVVSQIDIKRAQVLVEAIIVEVTDELSQSLGVEWNTSFSSGSGTEAATNFGIKQVNLDTAETILSGGLSLGYYSGGSLRALINALATEVDANILSTPSLMTLDNQEAEILVGSNVPFITGQSLVSSNGQSDPFTTIEREDIGLTLKVTPQINDGESVTLDILQILETIDETAVGAQDLVTNKRSIKTKVLVKDDTILVLGGLVSDQETEVVDKVPLLGDLPILGALFKTTTTQTIQRNLMVFIHPRIISDEMEGSSLSDDKYKNMQKLRDKYQP